MTLPASNILVLNQNVSGMNRFLFREIAKEWRVIAADVPYPRSRHYLRMARTFHPVGRRWKQRLRAATTRYHLSPACYIARSRIAAEAVRRHAHEASVVLQIGNVFNGLSAVEGATRLIFASFNTTLAYREWPPWAPFQNDRDFRQWYELERECYHRADHILCTNHYVRESFVRDYGIDPARLTHIGYGVNFDTLPTVEKPVCGNTALFVGYDFQRKGGPTVVEAFRRVRAVVPNARLRIVGPKILDKQYLIEGVDYLPPVNDRAAMQRIFTEASFYVMPSVCEPFGLVFLEAMACENACIGSKNNAMPEIIEHGKTGYVIDAGNVDQLTEYMTGLFVNSELARTMGQAAACRLRREFTWDQCGERVRALLRSLA